LFRINKDKLGKDRQEGPEGEDPVKYYYIWSNSQPMIPVDICEPYFEYLRKYIDVDPPLMQLIASQLSEAHFPEKHIIPSHPVSPSPGPSTSIPPRASTEMFLRPITALS